MALIERVLLEVEAGAVDVGAQDVEALLQRAAAQMHQHERLAVGVGPDLVSRLEGAALGDALLQRHVSRFLCLGDSGGRAFALGLVLADEGDVAAGHLLKLSQLLFAVFLPCVLALHGTLL